MTSKRMDNYNKCNNTRISQRFGKKSEFAKKTKNSIGSKIFESVVEIGRDSCMHSFNPKLIEVTIYDPLIFF